MSVNETTIQAVRLVKEAVGLHDSCTAVSGTHQLISAVQQAHSKYMSYLENKTA